MTPDHAIVTDTTSAHLVDAATMTYLLPQSMIGSD
jgi:hypothetical protein